MKMKVNQQTKCVFGEHSIDHMDASHLQEGHDTEHTQMIRETHRARDLTLSIQDRTSGSAAPTTNLIHA